METKQDKDRVVEKLLISYLFTQEDLDNLMNKGGKKLDGIRADLDLQSISRQKKSFI